MSKQKRAELVTGKPAKSADEKALAAVNARLGSARGESAGSIKSLKRRKLELNAKLGRKKRS